MQHLHDGDRPPRNVQRGKVCLAWGACTLEHDSELVYNLPRLRRPLYTTIGFQFTMSLKTIAVMGPTGSGKSTFINSLVPPGSTSGTRVGHSLRSETNKIQPVELDNGNGLSFKLVDTPGFDDSREGITDIDVLSMIAAFLVQEEEHSMLAGLIYMHRISDTRMGGTARRNLRVFHKLCGQDSLKNVVVVTTMWDKVTLEEGERRERELQSSETLFKPLLDEGAVMCRHDGTPASALGIIDYLLRIQDHATTQIVHELLYDQKTLENTAAGTEIQSELRAILQKHSADIKSLEEEMRSATTASAKDEIAVQKRELELSADKLNKQIQDLKRRSGANETFQPAREHTTHPVSFQSPPRSSSFDLSRYPSRAIECAVSFGNVMTGVTVSSQNSRPT
ncbi:P-loop containing nucleoside triphosphate hydrolase protein [Pisolithus thermaeus]|nr:P-loop containing nucleoside triphosphate hydrolase protein [Pisolithus thermaeus]